MEYVPLTTYIQNSHQMLMGSSLFKSSLKQKTNGNLVIGWEKQVIRTLTVKSLSAQKELLNVAYASCSPAGNRRFRHFSLHLVSHNGCCHIDPSLAKKNDKNILEVCSICLCLISSLNLCRSLKWMQKLVIMLTAKRQKILNQLSKLLDTPQVFQKIVSQKRCRCNPCWMFFPPI